MELYLNRDQAKEAITELCNDLLARIEKGEDVAYTIRKREDDKGDFVEFTIVSRMNPAS
jgi:hypothetical protein